MAWQYLIKINITVFSLTVSKKNHLRNKHCNKYDGTVQDALKIS